MEFNIRSGYIDLDTVEYGFDSIVSNYRVYSNLTEFKYGFVAVLVVL